VEEKDSRAGDNTITYITIINKSKQNKIMKNLEKSYTFNGYTFHRHSNNLYEGENFYECRGDVFYDDDHDETPDPELWSGAIDLQKYFKSIGIDSDVSYSEKGWVEVYLD
jgi:hypothetical protein